MDVKMELAEKFYSLPGSTLPKKKKSFTDFINELNCKILPENDKRDFIMSLTPKNKLEELLKIDLMLHYQLSQDIIQLLKSGNALYIGKVLKDWSFFKETFKNLTANTLVNDILPYTSYSTRMKILNRISKNLTNEELADDFYESVEEKYGNNSANALLVCCSMEFIKTKLNKYNLKLQHKQLVMILKKDPEFLHYYLNHLKTKSISPGQKNDHKLSKIILKYDEKMLWELADKFQFYPNFGKHLSKQLLRKNEHLLNDITDRNHFKSRRIYQELRKNPEKFKNFFLNQMPKDIDDFKLHTFMHKYETSTFINYISEKKRYFFINSIFKEKYGFDFVDKHKLVSEELLSLMPEDVREQIRLARMKENDAFDGVDPKVAIPIVIEKIRHTSNKNRRMDYIKDLYNICANKKDEKQLLEVMKYLEKRHRNDTDVLSHFYSILSDWPDIELFNEDHWNYIDIIKGLLEIKNIRVYNNLVHRKKTLDRTLEHDHYHNDCAYHVKGAFDNLQRTIYTDFFQEHPNYRIKCLFELKEVIDKSQGLDTLRGLQGQFLHAIYQHNISITSSEYEIPILDYLPLFNELLRYNFPTLKPVVIYYVRLYYAEFNPIIWKFRKGFFKDYSLFRWYLLNHEDELLQNINSLIDINAIRRNKSFLNRLSKCSFRNIPEQITAYCLELLKKDDISDKIYAIKTLSFLNQQEFFNVITSTFLPNEDGKLNIEDRSDKLKLQQVILSCLERSVNPVDAISIIRLFCKGDYLKYALRPLYSVASKVPEKRVEVFLKELHDSPVSVRKHVIHLSRLLCSLDEFCVFIKEQCLQEKNSSLKSILFQKVLECAAITPSKRFYDLLKITMHGIDKKDVDAHDALLKIDKVPKEFRGEYVTEAYEIFNTSSDEEIRGKRFQLMENIPAKTYDQIDCILLETFMYETMCSANMPYYWINCVFRTTGEKQNTLYELALKIHEEHHERLNTHGKIHQDDKGFMNALCRNFIYSKSSFSMVDRFKSLWFAKFSPDQDISAYVFVLFVWTYAKSEYNIEIFARNVKEMASTFLKEFNECLFNLFAINFSDFLKEVNANSTHFVKLLLNMQDDVTCLLAIYVMSKNVPTDKPELAEYIAILDKLKNHPELSIRTYFSFYLSNVIKTRK